MKRKNSVLWIILAVVAAVTIGCGGLFVLAVALAGLSNASMGGAVAIVEVKGTIVSGEAPSGFATQGVAYAERVIQDLEQADMDPSVRAIILEVDSPGGGVTASADIHRALTELSKPVVTSMGDLAASGGYYIACGTRRILARPSTLTGSISVITQFTNAQELLDRLGIQIQIVKTGQFKDQGGLHRPLTEQELAMFQELLDESYNEFVRVVAEGRGMSEEQARALADGRIFSGRQAQENGLVDELGDLDDAVQVAAELGGIRGEPRIVRYRRPTSFFQALPGFLSRLNQPVELTLLRELLGGGQAPTMQYLYTGR